MHVRIVCGSNVESILKCSQSEETLINEETLRARVETLINEEALLLAKYLRAKRDNWTPRIARAYTSGAISYGI